MKPFSLDIRGNLKTYGRSAVMGIINATPDSFYSRSRVAAADEAALRAAEMVAEGADFIDIGAYSSRPGAAAVSEKEEAERLRPAVEAVRHSIGPGIPISVDTFRASVAYKAIDKWGADIVNDISAGMLDGNMFDTVADLRVPYIIMHMRGTPETMQTLTEYGNITCDVMRELGERLEILEQKGVCDVIVDPGFGFAKTLEQNYRLMAELKEFRLLRRPVLVGISRKSMLTRLLGIQAGDAMNATTALNTIALMNGADILRVHDVRAAVEAVEIYSKLCECAGSDE